MSAVQSSSAAPASVTEAQTTLPSGGQSAPGTGAQGLDSWIENFRKYEATLQDVNKATAEPKFKAELDTIEQWYKVLNEPERTASVYTLLMHSNQEQIRFYISVLQQMAKPEAGKTETGKTETKTETKTEEVSSASTTPVGSAKLKAGARRPPTLDLPELGDPTTPTAESAPVDASKNRLAGLRTNAEESSEQPEGIAGLPGLGMMSPYHLNMIANAGLSKEAQLLAVQLIMSGIVQPTGATAAAQPAPKAKKPVLDTKNWRTPTSAKYPGSALRTGGLRAAALKSAGLKNMNLPHGLPSASLPSAGLQSAGLDSPSGGATPREEDFKPEMLDDIPSWLRTLRLHKYNSCFDGLSWQEMVVLDDATLEAKGVAALGARRRLLRTFEFVRRRMGLESSEDADGANSATPTTSTLPKPAEGTVLEASTVPKSAAPTSKLSITSPVFVPSFDRAPQSAAPTVSAPEVKAQ